MDREEFKLRTDEIKALVREGQYPEAVKIADSIDWKRVKSVQMLGMVGDLYKVTGNLEKSRNAMLLAYDRDPADSKIIYSLCELAIKLGDFISSVEYMKEYARQKPEDPGVYILRYKLIEAHGVSLEERAELLEEYQTREFKPKWGYELASLYHGIGDEPRLVGECDAIFDYFAGDMRPSAHRYVLKALELKELHTVLSSAQQAYLDSARAAEQAKRDAEEAERRRLEEEARRAEEAKLAAEAERERRAEERRAAKGHGGTGYIRTETGRLQPQGAHSTDTGMYAPVTQNTGVVQTQTGTLPAATGAVQGEIPDGSTTVFSPVRAEPSSIQGQSVNPYDTSNFQQELAKNVQDVMPDSGYEPEVFTGYHPNPYEKKSKSEKPQSGHRGAVRHKQRRYDNILSLEGDGQISLVLPEDEVIERQITGQISIDDIMERLHNYSKETQEARVEQIVRGRTEGMFNSFERQAKEGPQAELDKMLGLDRVTAREVAGAQEKKKVSLISKPAISSVVHPQVEDAIAEKESTDNARAETTALNLNMGTPESAAALETAKAGIGSERKATAIETADATSASEEAATALETNETTSDSTKTAMALMNATASDITGGAAATTAGTVAAAGVMTVGAQIVAKSTGIPAYLLSKEVRPTKNDETKKEETPVETPAEAETNAQKDSARTEAATVVPTDTDTNEEKTTVTAFADADDEEIDAAADAQIEPLEDDSEEDADYEEEALSELKKTDDEVSAEEDNSVETEDEDKSAGKNEPESEQAQPEEDIKAEGEAKSEENAQPADDTKSEENTQSEEDTKSEDDVQSTDETKPEEAQSEDNVQPTEEIKSESNLKPDDATKPVSDEKPVSADETDAKTQPADSVTETEQTYTPSETSNVSGDTAEFEAIRVLNQEELKNMSDEELSARIEAMSEAEREQYGHILHNHMILRQILMAAEELSERGKFGVVVLGKDNALTLDIAKGLVRTSTKDYKSFTGKAAKIKGADLKSQKVPEFFKQLHNGALIITGAGRINKDAAVALSKAMHENARFTMVILTDTDKHIRDLMNREPSLEELFKVKVDTEIAGGDDSLVAYGKEYAREREYSIDNLGTLALHTRIEELQTFEHKATIDDVRAIVDEAIANSSKKKFSHFVEVLSHKRYDDEDMIILREKDFLHQ